MPLLFSYSNNRFVSQWVYVTLSFFPAGAAGSPSGRCPRRRRRHCLAGVPSIEELVPLPDPIMYIDQYSVDRQMFLDNRWGNELRNGNTDSAFSGGRVRAACPGWSRHTVCLVRNRRPWDSARDRLWLYGLPAMIGVMLGSSGAAGLVCNRSAVLSVRWNPGSVHWALWWTVLVRPEHLLYRPAAYSAGCSAGVLRC